jgi:predicted nucleic-acid-binding protein
LAETVWVLDSVCGQNPEDLAAAVQMLLDHRDFVIQESETVLAALELFRARPALGFSDCLLLHLAEKPTTFLLAFDRALAKVDGAQSFSPVPRTASS